MNKLIGRLHYYFFSYIHQGILNARVLLILLGVYLVFYVGCHGLSDKLSEFGMRINPLELVSSVLGARSIYFILFALFALWLHCFDYREDCQYELIRLGKKRWLFRQYLFSFFTAVIFYLWSVICLAAMAGGRITL